MITVEAREKMPGGKCVGPRRAWAPFGPLASRTAVRGLCGLAAAACVVMLASACGGEGKTPARAAAAMGSKSPAAVGHVGDPGRSNASDGVSPNQAPSTATRPPASYEPGLTAIRVAEHGAYDQAVFQFTNGIPRYTIGYVPAVSQDAKGTPVALPGRSFLRVAFHPASAAGYPGPAAISPYFPTLLQISAAGDFEGYLSFGLGLSGRGGYRAYTLTNPGRVVIEFPHVTLPKFPGIWDITSWRQFWEAQTAVENGHQPWLGSPAMVVRAWARSFSSQPTIRQTGADTFQVTDPTDPVRPRMAIVSGTRPVTTGQAQLWVITSISFVPS